MFKNEVVSALLKVAASTIAFEDLGRYLPFQTRIVSGETFNHIQSRTAYDIVTRGRYTEYTVEEFETLCRRTGPITHFSGGVQDENCPGCTAIAQGIIKRDIENA